MSKSPGNPILSVRVYPDELELIEAYQRARGLERRTQAVTEILSFALGKNSQGHSVFDELPKGGSFGKQITKARKLHRSWQSKRHD